jgi:acyl-CoA dehydrogenase
MELLAILSGVPWGWVVLGVLLVIFVLGFAAAPVWAWALAGVLVLAGLGAPWWVLLAFVVIAALFVVQPLRRAVLSAPLLRTINRLGIMPAISETERTAIEAGTVWIEGELFSGRPNFDRILNESYPALTPEESAFLEGPVEELCQMADEWSTAQARDLPQEVWDFIKDQRLFGMIIPRKYGGLGFSALANSAVVAKLASRNGVASTTVMVPNSLGPAELLIHYGTEQQKNHYLPRLARGEDIPAFALTEPNAGSDAGSIASTGDVFRGEDGELYLRLNWEKRYITLASISTVLGLAFRMRDPDNLLGGTTDLGITCALVPTDIPGVEVGRRHDPLGVPFYNSPTTGVDVVLPLDSAVIGGREGIGQGWRMLMESLAAGRGISLPASATGSVKLTARTASAHARVRQQFGLPIGKFEGVEEPLARIGGYLYTLDAARHFTCGAIMQGAKPAVVTAMTKYTFTELARETVNDGMDILGGNGISRGPRNLLAGIYQGAPIAITVEGANILTRTLMVFGQGAIRCHPYAYREIQALAENDVDGFDKAFWSHVGHVVVNAFRSLGLGLTRGLIAPAPVSGFPRRYWQRLAWASASFAFLADLAMASLGGDLKRKEKLTGRFADIFSWMYLGSAVLRRFEAEGRIEADRPFVAWAMEQAFWRIQQGFDGIYDNLEVPGLTWWLRGPGSAWNRFNRIGAYPADDLGQSVAQALQVPGDQRERLMAGMFVPADPEEALGRLERALNLVYLAESVEHKIKDAIRSKKLPRKLPSDQLVAQAIAAGVISGAEAALLGDANDARNDAIQVDAFTLEEYEEGGLAMKSADTPPSIGDGASVRESTGQTAYGQATSPTEPDITDA